MLYRALSRPERMLKLNFDPGGQGIPTVPVVINGRLFRHRIKQRITVYLAAADGKNDPCVLWLAVLNILAQDRGRKFQLIRSTYRLRIVYHGKNRQAKAGGNTSRNNFLIFETRFYRTIRHDDPIFFQCG
jgi:hypothetical protein